MTEKNSLAGKPYTYFAVCFIFTFSWEFANEFFSINDKIPSHIFQNVIGLLPLIILPNLLFRFDSGLKNIYENEEGLEKFAYLTLGGWFGGVVLFHYAVKQYF